MWAAQRMGLDAPIVERARELHGPRGLAARSADARLSELRQELESERRLALRMREESEAVRAAPTRRAWPRCAARASRRSRR